LQELLVESAKRKQRARVLAGQLAQEDQVARERFGLRSFG